MPWMTRIAAPTRRNGAAARRSSSWARGEPPPRASRFRASVPGARATLPGAAQESLLLASGVAAGDGTTRIGLGEASEAPSVLLLGDGALIGADLFAAPADLRGAGQSRIAVVATNRLIGIAAAVLVIALAWALLGGDPAAALAAR